MQTNQRLDVFLHSHASGLSRSEIKKHIAAGRITVNNQEQKASYKVRAGDAIAIDIPMHTITAIMLPVLYEDQNCIVVNKPEGILSHSKGAYNPEPTVATWLQQRLNHTTSLKRPSALNHEVVSYHNQADALYSQRKGIVHRLDRLTSGVMICAKHDQAQKFLQKQFAARNVIKVYYAVIKAGLKPKEAIIDMPIKRDPKYRKQFRVDTNGKSAQTYYKVIESNNEYSLVELRPKTGRTHQLRVHLGQIGYPIIGDTLYGGHSFDRLMLHAERLEITLPTKQRKTFIAPLPLQFQRILA